MPPVLQDTEKYERFSMDKRMPDAFDKLKQYLQSPLVLMKSLPNEELYLYLGVSPLAVSAVLIRQEQRTEHPIYYVSRVLHDAKTRYQNIEKFAFAVVIAARKLCPYFLAHSIIVLTDQPLRNSNGSGAGLVLVGPDRFLVEYALKLDLKASNNEAEYEALLAGLSLALELEADRLKAHSDSQLIVGHINGLYEAKDQRMLKYLEKVRGKISLFKEFEIVQIFRTLNARADTLSRMASFDTTN
ncbi:uncharacterized protein LOC143857051 [Tasmannia lanceolata]|uniref:uncharacterized protein LOC143857051 n=1 Tax=Tasmannia lanceolata TaxID=3420 RepID=UPI0040633BBD